MEEIKCAYCGKVIDKNNQVRGKITFRTRDPYTRKACLGHRTNTYCKDKGCWGYDQMAHEG